jgi:predicted DNA-binding protein
MKRITLDLSDEIHRRLKIQCVNEGTNMAELLRKLVEDYLQKAERKTTKH